MSGEERNSKVGLTKIAIAIGLFFVFSIYYNCFSDEIETIELESETWSGEKVLEGNYVLPAGRTINIEKGAEIIFKNNSLITLEGGIISAVGTEKEPIVLKSFSGKPNSYYIKANDSSGIYFKNVDISGGGLVPEESPIELITFMNKARAEFDGYGVLTSFNPSFFVLDKCNIHDNSIGILISGAGERSFVQVNRSNFFDNTNFSVISSDGNSVDLDFQYNWWQSANKEGRINDSYKKTRKDFKDPVIVVPGIMGSTEKDGKWELDLILHTYDDLIESLIKSGYVRGVDLFLFPYEWRDSNVKNAILLKDEIQNIKNQTSSSRVDIVAHSMGGLLAREYLESDYYQDDIDQLIALGTPHQGAPASYLTWEAGEMGVKFKDKITEEYFKHEAKERGFDNLYDYVRNRPIRSIQELLPVYNYLWDKELGGNRNYPNNYPQNNFLENLNKNEKINCLAGIEFANIVGIRGASSTMISFKVKESKNSYWENGYPDDFEAIFGDRGIVYGSGDGTVPLLSASFPSEYAQYFIALNSEHTGLPTDAQQDVIELLTGIRPNKKIDDNLIENMLFVSVFSPIDILVTLSDRRRIGTDPETGEVFNEIEGAYYTGNETDNEFITIPNYEEMEYKISVRGTDNGDFRVEVISFDDIDGEAAEKQVENWQGTAVRDEIQTFDFAIGEVAVAPTAEENSVHYSVHDDVHEDEDDDDDKDADEEEDDAKDDEKKNKGGVSAALASSERDIFGNEIATSQDSSEEKLADYSSEQESNKSVNNPVVAGEKSSKSIRFRVATLMILIGVTLLTITWTVKRKNSKV